MNEKDIHTAMLRLLNAVETYLAEIDNPAADYTYRGTLRRLMRARTKELRTLLPEVPHDR